MLWLHLPVDISQVHFNGQRVFGELEVLEGMFLTGPPARHMTAQQTGLHRGRGGGFSLSFSHGTERVYTNCSKPSHSVRTLTQTLSVVPHSQQLQLRGFRNDLSRASLTCLTCLQSSIRCRLLGQQAIGQWAPLASSQ